MTSEAQKYYLKSIPALSGGPHSNDAKYTNRYVRYTGSGFSDVVISEGKPVFFKFFLSPEGKQLASSEKHGNRTWGFVISVSGQDEEAVVPVEMFEDKGDEGFYFEDRGDGEVVLKRAQDGKETGEWKGWIVRDNPPEKFKGNPQLYWSSSGGGNDSEDSGRVDFVREFV